MRRDNEISDFVEKGSGPGYMQLHNIFEELRGKKIRFCLKTNNYDRIVFFEAFLAGFYPCKLLEKMDSLASPDGTYRIENDKGIEIQLPIQKLIRIDEHYSNNTKNYFLIFERHFWSLEVLTG
jgi:hypothetical protein